ncbi:hypothetical protein [Ferruginivarius sediminum]|uniref:Uncharacterized protein n=1 Tax=Ferruginivarius sediminum TaxID=2661937 RepID=A0A369T807_9PROT|nr:hypothetical protein [Ferruginivarius sediminum]RDD61461.1 hypothetical protein DRB17_13380 [Ferruginivarius sediminum]
MTDGRRLARLRLDLDRHDSARAAAAQFLDQLAAATNDARYSRAAGHIRGSNGGRQPCGDDETALHEMRWLLESGKARSIRDAARKTAATMNSITALESVEDRLRRKYRKKFGSV